jgi:hypothetical protein
MAKKERPHAMLHGHHDGKMPPEMMGVKEKEGSKMGKKKSKKGKKKMMKKGCK